MKKIIFINSTYDFWGGGEKALECLIYQAEKKEKYSIFVITEKNDKFLHNIKSIENIELHYQKFSYKDYMNCSINLYKKVRQIEPDIIFLNGRKANLFSWYFKLFNKTAKILEWIHLPFFEKEKNKLKSLFLVCLHFIPSKFVDKTFCVSHEIKEERLKLRLNKKLQILYPPVEYNKLINLKKINIREQLKIPKENVMVLYPARVEIHKGQITFLKYLEKINFFEDYKDFTFVFSGVGLQDKILIQYAKKYPQQVLYLGFRKDVPQLMLSADYFLLYSSSEGLPISILEAMSLGLPVITTPVGELKHVLNDNNSFVITRLNKIINIITNKQNIEKLKLSEMRKLPSSCACENIFAVIEEEF